MQAKIGMPLFILGVIIASCFAAFPVTEKGDDGKALTGGARLEAWASHAGMQTAIGLILVVAGGLMARSGRKPKETDTAATAEGDPRTMLDGFQARLEGLDITDVGKNHATLHESLDALLEEEVPAFLEHRQAMIDKLGLATFAEMIGQFAGMERNAARAWSAITDEVWGEVPPCIDRAKIFLGHAINAYDKAV